MRSCLYVLNHYFMHELELSRIYEIYWYSQKIFSKAQYKIQTLYLIRLKKRD